MANDFPASRKSVLLVAVLGGTVTLLALIALEGFRDHVWVWAYAAATNVLGVLFGLAVVSLIWEFFVRRDHSTDLRHYLRLGSSVAQSGLQDVSSRSRLDWRALMSSANNIYVLTHSAEWLDRNAFHLQTIARERPLSVTIAVPIKGGSFLDQQARAQNKTAMKLAEDISDIVTRVARLWREDKAAGRLHKGSKLVIVEHEYLLGYELVSIDRATIVTMAAPGDSTEQQDRVAFVYSQNAEQYPSNFFMSYQKDLAAMNRLDEV